MCQFYTGFSKICINYINKGNIGASGMQTAIGSIICIASAITGDTSQDLKTGYLLVQLNACVMVGGIIYISNK